MRARNIIVAILLMGGWMTLSAEKIESKYATNLQCKTCHQQRSHQWETSRHAHAHYSKNDLYAKTLDYITSQDLTKTRQEVIVQCAKCHHPRIEKHRLASADKLNILLGVDTKQTHEVFDNANMRNGINCVVCHNVKEIHLDKSGKKRGFEAVTFGPQGLMYGPFKDAKSPYHKTQYQDFFVNDPNRLCFVCHYSDSNRHGVTVYATGKEYDAAPGDKPRCVECHMSAKKEGYATNYGHPKKRMVRDHLFASIDNSDMYKKYLEISGRVEKGKVVITLKNDTPHKIPTGYGLRRIEMKVRFFGDHDKLLKTVEKNFEAVWVDKNGKRTVPHLAIKLASDTRIPPKSKVTESIPIPAGTKIINYQLVYRQVSKEMAKRLGVKDPFFTQEYVLKNKVLEP